MKIIPTVLERDFSKARDRIGQIKDLSQWIQIDVIDGEFTTGKSFELELITGVEGNEKILWEIHLMTKEPVKWLEKCMFVGASRVTGQVEMMDSQEDFVNSCKDKGLEAALGFDIETEIEKIPKETDLVLLMTRKAGFGGFEIDKRIWGKIKILKQVQDDKRLNFKIGVDGGINLDNYQLFEKAGVDSVYCGSHYFEISDAYSNRNK